MDLLQEEQVGGVRIPLTRTHVQLQQTCNTYDGNMQEQKVSIFLKKQGLNGNWLMQVSSKENQNKYPECESFRNSTSAAWQGAKLFTALTKITLYFHCSSFNIFLPW